jgi:hypothetical protein
MFLLELVKSSGEMHCLKFAKSEKSNLIVKIQQSINIEKLREFGKLYFREITTKNKDDSQALQLQLLWQWLLLQLLFRTLCFQTLRHQAMTKK